MVCGVDSMDKGKKKSTSFSVWERCALNSIHQIKEDLLLPIYQGTPFWKEFLLIFSRLRFFALGKETEPVWYQTPYILPPVLAAWVRYFCWTYLKRWNGRDWLPSPDGNLSSSVPPSVLWFVSAYPYHHLPICIYSKSQNGGSYNR